jgi:hypothetical protein
MRFIAPMKFLGAKKLFSWPSNLSPAQAWVTLSLISRLVMEVTVISLWYQAIFTVEGMAWGRIWLILTIIPFVSFLLAMGMQKRKWKMPARWGVFLTWLVFALFASLKLLLFPGTAIFLAELLKQPFQFIFVPEANPTGFFHLFFVGLLVLRGVSLAKAQASLLGVQTSFQMGLVWLLLYGMGFAIRHAVDATIGLYLFLFLGLVAMTTARLSGLTELRGGRLAHFGLGWLTSVLAAALAVVGLAVAAGWLATNQVIVFIVRALAYLVTLVTGLLMMLVMPIVLALGRFLPVIIDFINRLIARLSSISLPKFLTDAATHISQALEKVIPYLMAARGLLLVGLLVLVLVSILLALHLRDRRHNDREEEDTAAAPPEDINFLRRLLDKLLQKARGLRLHSPGQILAAARIRQIYRQLMLLCKKLGAERKPSLTPLEFVPQLETVFPSGRPELDCITEAYVRVRYGEYPETMREIEQVETAWNQLRQEGKSLLRKKK